MYLDICEHPVRIKDKLTHRYKYVPCGKCNTCRNQAASTWIERIEQESQCHAFTLFVTLTYDEKHVPMAYLNPHDPNMLCDIDRDLYINLSDISGFKPSSRLYVHRRKRIPYADRKDIQDFFKRFRYYFENNLINNSNENKKIRYYCVSEYGPTTYRPHYHALIWFDSKTNARCISNLISKSWKFGRIDAQFAKGKCAQYVARYVNCVASLPKIYLHNSLRPFVLCSKAPAIGTLQINSKEIREIFDNGLVERVIYSQREHKSKVSPLWFTLENTLFPKVSGFNQFDHHERVTLYSIYSICPSEGFDNFLNWIEELYRKPFRTWLSEYLIDLLCKDKDSHYWRSDYCRLRSLYYTSSRVYHQRRVFGVSLDEYVSKIEQYYCNKEKYKLKKFYQFQESFVNEFGVSSPLIYMYDDPFGYLPDVLNTYLYNWYEKDNYLPRGSHNFGLDFTSPLSFSASLQQAAYYRKRNRSKFVQLNAKIVNYSRKSKRHNDYIQAVKNKGLFNFNIEKDYE